MNKNNIGKITKAVNKIIDTMPNGKTFHGWELKDKCVELYPELQNVYVDTFLRTMRANRKSNYTLIDRGESLYKKIGVATIHEAPVVDPYEKYKNLKQQSFDFMGGN